MAPLPDQQHQESVASSSDKSSDDLTAVVVNSTNDTYVTNTMNSTNSSDNATTSINVNLSDVNSNNQQQTEQEASPYLNNASIVERKKVSKVII